MRLHLSHRYACTIFTLAVLTATSSPAQHLSVKWEELTGPDFVEAIERAEGVCMLPFGVVEKHGTAGPLGTDLFIARHTTVGAAEREYAVVFPAYYFGQIFEAMHQPGTISYSRDLQLRLLQETVSEMARNGCRKIVIVNGHGGNTFLIQYFTQTQLDEPKDYVVYALTGLGGSGDDEAPPEARPSASGVDGHAGEGELSMVMAARPELVHPERSGRQSGENQGRLSLRDGLYTAIWWYAAYPNHYSGDSAGANVERGEALNEMRIAAIAAAIRAVKADDDAARLQQEFFEQISRPIDTSQ